MSKKTCHTSLGDILDGKVPDPHPAKAPSGESISFSRDFFDQQIQVDERVPVYAASLRAGKG